MSVKRSFDPVRCLMLISVLVLGLTLLPTPQTKTNKSGKANWIPFHRHGPQLICTVTRSCQASPEVVAEAVGNVGLFLPFGSLLCLGLRRRRYGPWLCVLLAALAGLVFSLGIEMAQFRMSTRYTDIDDVILNGSGALLGAILALALRQRRAVWSPARRWSEVPLSSRRC